MAYNAIFRGFSANLAFYKVKDAWRYQLGSALLPALLLIGGILFCPGQFREFRKVRTSANISIESPRWYIKKRRYADAFQSLRRLRKTDLQAARDLYYIYAQVKMEEDAMREERTHMRKGDTMQEERTHVRSNYAQRFVELFTISRIRRSTLAAFTVMLAQQMCGSTYYNLLLSNLGKPAKLMH